MIAEMINKKFFMLGLLITVITIFLSLVGVTTISSKVLGANQSNTITKVFVWNTDPNLYAVNVAPDPIDLSPGNTTEVNCTAYIWDYNGWQDVKNIKASFYDVSYGDGTEADNNYRYINNSCGNATTSCTALSPTNASCTCSFNVWYYANNGTWQCNMTITDAGGNATERFYYMNASLNSSYATINTVVALNTPAELDYGNLSVTETSEDTLLNISNFGNLPINLSVRGYGGTSDPNNPLNLTMICDYNNISIGYQRFSTSAGNNFVDMTNLTNSTTDVPNFFLPVRTNDTTYGNDTNLTYWKLQIPLSVGGHCNGTIEFNAYES